MRRPGTALALFGALLLHASNAPAASSSEQDDYARVSDADTAVAEGDFARAERQLALVAPESKARREADLVQAKLDRARAPTLTSESALVSDDQPFARWGSLLEVNCWVASRLELGAGVEAGSLVAPQKIGVDGALLSGRLRLGAALLDLSAWGGVRRWFDGAESAQGDLALTLFPTGKVRARLGAGRADEISTFTAITQHVQRDGVVAEVELHSFSRFSGALRGDIFAYSDGNAGASASGWLTFMLLEEPVRFDIGYASAYRGTAASRWDPVAGVYLPYYTPLQAVRHGPSASLSVRRQIVSAILSAHYALHASERDPSTIGYYYSRLQMRHMDLRAGASLSVAQVVVATSYRYLLESYYAAHALEVKVHVPL